MDDRDGRESWCTPSRDHRVPKSRGGRNVVENIEIVCRHHMVRQMLHEHATSLSAEGHANRSRRLIKCAKDSGHYLQTSPATTQKKASARAISCNTCLCRESLVSPLGYAAGTPPAVSGHVAATSEPCPDADY